MKVSQYLINAFKLLIAFIFFIVDADTLIDDNEECIYLCGQSLGLQLKSVENNVQDILYDWANR